MKIILVDAVYCFISPEGVIFEEMYSLLQNYPNKKILVTGADDTQYIKFGLDKMPYEVFTLKHNPEKTDPRYFEMLLVHLGVTPKDVIYFEHSPEAVKSAESLGIRSYLYDDLAKDLVALKSFLDDVVIE